MPLVILLKAVKPKKKTFGQGWNYYKVNNYYRDPMMRNKRRDQDEIKAVLDRRSTREGARSYRKEAKLPYASDKDEHTEDLTAYDEPGDLRYLPRKKTALPSTIHPQSDIKRARKQFKEGQVAVPSGSLNAWG